MARVIGSCMIALLWATAGYLLVYYALLLSFGPDRLCSMLGGDLYNAVIPMGGFNLLLLVAVLAMAWGTPLAMASAVAFGVLRLVWLSASSRARLRTAVLFGILLTASLPRILLDGWPDPLWSVVFGDDSEFASGYTAWGFCRVHQGMTTDEVLARVGTPLERYPIAGQPDQEGWRWTRSPHDSSYRIRAVVFKDGRVARKYSEFYVD